MLSKALLLMSSVLYNLCHYGYFYTAVCCLVGLEKASCRLVEVCLANPQYFYVTEVLGPACIAIAEAEANAVALTREYKSLLGHKLAVVCEPPVNGMMSIRLQLPVGMARQSEGCHGGTSAQGCMHRSACMQACRLMKLPSHPNGLLYHVYCTK